MDVDSRIPVTLLTGFLGAGKTARLNSTLAAGLARIAVIENEIGSLGVDGALVANTHDDGVIELSNGCLCCSAEIDLVGALEALAHRRASRPFEHVMIETTGLADVAPVIELLSDPDDALAEDFIFAGVITIVDAAGFHIWAKAPGPDAPGRDVPMAAWASGFGAPTSSTLKSSQEERPEPAPTEPIVGLGRAAALTVFWRQVALADTIVVSKADLVDDVVIQDVQAAVSAVNPLANIVVEPSCAKGAAPLPLSHGQLNKLRSARPQDPRGVVRLCGTRAQRGDRSHLAGVQALTLRPPPRQPLRAEPLQALARALLTGGRAVAKELGEAWRIKGLVVVAGSGASLVQGVGDQIEFSAWPHAVEEEPFLVVIGEGLCQKALEEALLSCADSTPVQAELEAPIVDVEMR